MSMDDALRSASARAHMAEKSRRHLYGADADAQAELLLRHRLFPRAMAWNATQQAASSSQVAQVPAPYEQPPPSQPRAESWSSEHRRELEQMQPVDGSPLPMAALRARARQQSANHQRQSSLDVTGSFTAQLHAFNLDDPQLLAPAQQQPQPLAGDIPAKAIHEALSFARSFPLLHAANGVIEQELRRHKENMSVDSNAGRSSSAPFALPPHDAREKLFRTMGKWFDGSSSGSNSAANSRASFASSAGSAALGDDGFLQHIPRRATFDSVAPPPPIAISFASTASTSFTSLGASANSFSTAQSAQPPPAAAPGTLSNSFSGRSGNRRMNEPPKAASFSHVALPVHRESHGTPSPTRSTSNRSVASEPRDRRSPPRSTSSAAAAAYGKKRQRATPAPSLAKALLTGCGAKRCSFEDCGKIAVSKGLCRGHGGGRRCQFAGCTKCAQSRSPFCWAHGGGKRCEAPNCRRSRKTKHYCVDHVDMEGSAALPSGGSPADSDESMEGGAPSTPASDVDVVLTKSLSPPELPRPRQSQSQRQPVRRDTSSSVAAGRRAQLAAQLPSLNDALKRSFPSPDAFQAAQASEHMFQLQLQLQQQQHAQTFNFDIRR